MILGCIFDIGLTTKQVPPYNYTYLAPSSTPLMYIFKEPSLWAFLFFKRKSMTTAVFINGAVGIDDGFTFAYPV